MSGSIAVQLETCVTRRPQLLDEWRAKPAGLRHPPNGLPAHLGGCRWRKRVEGGCASKAAYLLWRCSPLCETPRGGGGAWLVGSDEEGRPRAGAAHMLGAERVGEDGWRMEGGRESGRWVMGGSRIRRRRGAPANTRQDGAAQAGGAHRSAKRGRRPAEGCTYSPWGEGGVSGVGLLCGYATSRQRDYATS